MMLIPAKSAEAKISVLRKSLSTADLAEVERRVEYYNKINFPIENPPGSTIGDLLHPKTPKAYYFDAFEVAKYFPKIQRIDFRFGDVNTVLDRPAFTKSRPLGTDNGNNILLNLDKARHFVSVKDDLIFENKKDMLVGRAAVHQAHRIAFYERYFHSPLCDLGQVNKTGGNAAWIRPKLPISEHLKYKFILSLEGNDVATNLKWIMSSNSVAVSPPLKMESWYMEGTLVADEHFIGIKDDYSNLQEKLQYYLDRPAEANEIIANAKQHRSKFSNKNKELLISILVLRKYFDAIV